jgi:8-oxo-dGTP diphosphatase
MSQMIRCRDWNEKMHEISLEKVSFRISAYGVIVRDNAILLSPQRDGYDFPGGGMEIGETLKECLLREVKEETGLFVKMGEIVHTDHEFYYSISSQQAFNNILLYFLCYNPQGKISTDGFDEYEKLYARKAEWVSLDRIETIKFHNPVDSVAVINKSLKMRYIQQ